VKYEDIFTNNVTNQTTVMHIIKEKHRIRNKIISSQQAGEDPEDLEVIFQDPGSEV